MADKQTEIHCLMLGSDVRFMGRPLGEGRVGTRRGARILGGDGWAVARRRPAARRTAVVLDARRSAERRGHRPGRHPAPSPAAVAVGPHRRGSALRHHRGQHPGPGGGACPGRAAAVGRCPVRRDVHHYGRGTVEPVPLGQPDGEPGRSHRRGDRGDGRRPGHLGRRGRAAGRLGLHRAGGSPHRIPRRGRAAAGLGRATGDGPPPDLGRTAAHARHGRADLGGRAGHVGAHRRLGDQ